MSTVDPETLLRSYSMVFQDVVLFDDTVMENIRLGKRGATDEEVRAAAEAANCDEFVRRLPKGYDTPIGENGSRLSGGERQRISIARALLKNAPIVLLDEATASLDVENETKVQGALSRLLVGKTVLVFLGLCVLEGLGILFSMFAWSWGLLALLWIFEKLLLLLAVLALALMCRKLLLGGRALAAGDLSYQVDTSRMVLDFNPTART